MSCTNVRVEAETAAVELGGVVALFPDWANAGAYIDPAATVRAAAAIVEPRIFPNIVIPSKNGRIDTRR